MRVNCPTSRFSYLTPHLAGLALVLCGLLAALLVPRTGGDGWVRTLAELASKEGNATFISLGILTLLGLAYAARSKADASRAFWVMAIATLLAQGLQKGLFYGFHLLPRPSGHDGGFPSAHATDAVALAYLLTERFPRLAPLWYAVAALISWSRVEAGAHYPYQVIAGAVLGLAVAVVYFQVVEPRQKRQVRTG